MSDLDWNRDGADWPQRDASRFVQAGGVRWHVQEDGSGPLLLLIHGTAASTHSWRGLWPLLLPHARLMAVDLPGHGFTTRAAHMSLPAIADGLGALLEELGATPQHVAGHSAGAAIAARMVLDGQIRPDAICGLGAALTPFPGAAAVAFPAMARFLFLNPVAAPMAAGIAALPGEPARFLGRATGSRIDAEGAALYGRLFRSRSHVAAALAMMASWDLVPLSRDLARLDVPLLLLHGEQDRAIPARSATDLARRIPGARARIVPGLGHLLHEEAPAAIAPIVRAMVAEPAAMAAP